MKFIMNEENEQRINEVLMTMMKKPATEIVIEATMNGKEVNKELMLSQLFLEQAESKELTKRIDGETGTVTDVVKAINASKVFNHRITPPALNEVLCAIGLKEAIYETTNSGTKKIYETRGKQFDKFKSLVSAFDTSSREEGIANPCTFNYKVDKCAKVFTEVLKIVFI